MTPTEQNPAASEPLQYYSRSELPQSETKLHRLSPRRKSTLIGAALLCALGLATAAGAMALGGGDAGGGRIALCALGSAAAIVGAGFLLVRLGVRITALEGWIRRMGAGDLAYTLRPTGNDEVTEVFYDLEVLRRRSMRSQELDVVQELSQELQDKNGELETALDALRNAQDQVISRQKLAELGELTAGVAHEIRNPLNLVQNFARNSSSMMGELTEIIEEAEGNPSAESREEIADLIKELTENMARIREHGDRANRIVHDMLAMGRSSRGQYHEVEVNRLVEDHAMLAYHAVRNWDPSFNMRIEREFDEDAGVAMIISEDIGRVILKPGQQRVLRDRQAGRAERRTALHGAPHPAGGRPRDHQREGQRRRHPRRRGRPDLQPVLHDQAAQRGNRTGPQPLQRHRPGARRRTLIRDRGRPVHPVHRAAAGPGTGPSMNGDWDGPAIICRDMHKWYGGFHAVRGVSLQVQRGEVLVIMGPSGSGKSTFLRLLNRLERHQRGDILVDGIQLNDDLRDIDAVRRKAGMVVQSFHLFAHMSVMDNVTLAPRKVLRLAPEDARARATALLDRVGVADQAEKPVHQLSSGQQQRVAIARALAMGPDIMLFDEPTSALDAEMVTEVVQVIGDLARAHMTIVAVTHEMRVARDLADRVVVFDEGQVVEDRPPADFFERPRHPRVRNFLNRIIHP